MAADDYGKVEAVLFAAGKPTSLNEISRLTGIDSRKRLLNALQSMKQHYDERGSALKVIEEGENWGLTIAERYSETVRKIVPHTELSKTLMETLAVIAWKAPVMQSKVIDIRTNKAYDHIDELERLQFINKEKRGRSYVLRLTHKFFDYFDVAGKNVRDMFKEFQQGEGPKVKKLPRIEVIPGIEVYDTPLKAETIKEDSIRLFERLGKLQVYTISEEKVEEKQEAMAEEVPEKEPELFSPDFFRQEKPVKQEPAPKTEGDVAFENKWKAFEDKLAAKAKEADEPLDASLTPLSEFKRETPSLTTEEAPAAPTADESVEILKPKRAFDEANDDEDAEEDHKETEDEQEKKDEPDKKEDDTSKKKDKLDEHIIKNFDLGF